MAGFAPDEEIELFEVNQFACHLLYYVLMSAISSVKREKNCWHFVLYIQEIKFEPHVMCELVNKKTTFRASQVLIISE